MTLDGHISQEKKVFTVYTSYFSQLHLSWSFFIIQHLELEAGRIFGLGELESLPYFEEHPLKNVQPNISPPIGNFVVLHSLCEAAYSWPAGQLTTALLSSCIFFSIKIYHEAINVTENSGGNGPLSSPRLPKMILLEKNFSFSTFQLISPGEDDIFTI